MSNLTKLQLNHWLSYDLYANPKLDQITELAYLATIRSNLMTYLRPFFGANVRIGLTVHLFANGSNPLLYFVTGDYQIVTIKIPPKLEQGELEPGITAEAASAAPHNPPGGPPPPPPMRVVLNGTNFTEFDDSNYLRVETPTMVVFQKGSMQNVGQTFNAEH